MAIAATAGRSASLTALGFDATRELALSPAMGDFRVVHFATHTVLDTRHPELSGIVLTLVDRDRQRVNGFLRLHDIFNMKLSAEVVVLSACQTALGQDVRGEGLIASRADSCTREPRRWSPACGTCATGRRRG